MFVLSPPPKSEKYLGVCQYLRNSLGYILTRSMEVDQLTSLGIFCIHLICLLTLLSVAFKEVNFLKCPFCQLSFSNF